MGPEILGPQDKTLDRDSLHPKVIFVSTIKHLYRLPQNFLLTTTEVIDDDF